jgi:acetate kinase
LARTPRAAGRLLIAHLGNGASLCACQWRAQHRARRWAVGAGRPDDGHAQRRHRPRRAAAPAAPGLDWAALEKLLYKQSGLLGVSGFRPTCARCAPAPSRAPAAIELFTYRVVRESGALVACLGGLDVLAFTGGIGEHDKALRADVGAALAYLGMRIDAAANQAADGNALVPIHAADSRWKSGWCPPTKAWWRHATRWPSGLNAPCRRGLPRICGP